MKYNIGDIVFNNRFGIGKIVRFEDSTGVRVQFGNLNENLYEYNGISNSYYYSFRVLNQLTVIRRYSFIDEIEELLDD